jgi:hypothetical protein
VRTPPICAPAHHWRARQSRQRIGDRAAQDRIVGSRLQRRFSWRREQVARDRQPLCCEGDRGRSRGRTGSLPGRCRGSLSSSVP